MDPSESIISISNPLEKANEIWAACDVMDKQGTINRMELSTHSLEIIRTDGKDAYPVNSLHSISIGRKKYLLPIIIGGISGPLSLVSLYNGLYAPTFLILLFSLAIFLIYYGIMGSQSLIIRTTGSEQNMFIKENNQQLEQFMQFCNLLIPQLRKKEKLYFFARLSAAHLTTDSSMANIRLYTQDTLDLVQEDFERENNHESKIVKIDPILLTGQIHMKRFSDDSYGMIVENLNTNSIVDI